MDWSQHRVLVTGATGIVGSWLVKRLLQENAYIVALIHDWDPQTELIRSGDIHRTSVVGGALQDYTTIERAINEHEVDTVIHLGAQTIVGTALRNPLPTFEANIRGTYNLLEACRVHASLVKRVVVASSDKAYGDSEVLPYSEDMPLKGQHPYDVSKSCSDLIALSYAHTYDLPVTVARCGNVYGGCDLNWSRIVPGTIRALLRKQRPIIRSDGKHVRDYLYVKDAVEAYLCLAAQVVDAKVRGQAFNFSAEAPMTVIKIVGEIQELMNCHALKPDIRNYARAEIREQHLSAAKARSILGWKPKYDLATGLKQTIEWYTAYLG